MFREITVEVSKMYLFCNILNWSHFFLLGSHNLYKAILCVILQLVTMKIKRSRKKLQHKRIWDSSRSKRNASRYREDRGFGDKSFSIFLGRSFQVLVSEPSLFRLELDGKRGSRFVYSSTGSRDVVLRP